MFFIFFSVSLVNREIDYNKQFNTFFFWYILLGVYISSRAFSEIHKQDRAYQYLTLPVSNFERFFVVIIINFLLYLIGGIFFFLIISFLANSMAANFGKFSFKYFDLNIYDFFKLFTESALLFSIFFAGSVTFNKHPFLKTILVIISYAIMISFIAYIIYKLIDFDLIRYRLDLDKSIKIFNDNVSSKIINLIYTFLIWLYTYFKLQEKEI